MAQNRAHPTVFDIWGRWLAERVGFEPTVRITAQRLSSSKILKFDPAIQCENVSPGLAFLVPRRGL